MPGLNRNDLKLLLNFNGPDGSKGIIDRSNSSHIITRNGDAQLDTAQKKFGTTSLLTDGTDGNVRIPNSDNFELFKNTSDIITFSGFFRVVSSDVGVMFGVQSDSTNGWRVDVRSGNEIRLFYRSSATVRLNIETTSNPIIYDQWQHIAIFKTNSGSSVIIGVYVDGQQVLYGSTTNLTDFNGSLDIGSLINSSSFINQYVDDFFVTDNNFFGANPDSGLNDTITVPTSNHTPDSNTKLYLDFEPLDESDNTHDPVFNGDAQLDTAQKKFGTASALFDGTGDYLELADSSDWDVVGSNSDNWTIECWIRPSVLSGTVGLIVQREDDSNIWRLIQTSDDGIQFRFNSGGTAIINMFKDAVLSLNTWTHVAVCKVANEYGLYIDGNQEVYDSSNTTDTFSGPLHIGMMGESGSPVANEYSGHIDEVHISNENIFGASPNSTPDDTITVPTSEYFKIISRNSQGIII